MITRRQVLSAAAMIVIGLGQASDSHAFAAGPLITGLALAAVAVPALTAIVTTLPAVYWGAVVLTGVLTIGARVLSPMPLPELTLLMLIAAPALLGPAFIENARRPSKAGT